MKVNVKFVGITCSGGRLTSKIESMEVPDFEVILNRKFKNYDLPPVSIDSQIMDWLDERDNEDIMEKHDFHSIMDYRVHRPKKQISFVEVVTKAITDPKMLADFMAVYFHMEGALKGVGNMQKVSIVLSSMTVGYKAQTVVSERMMMILDGKDPDKQANLIGK